MTRPRSSRSVVHCVLVATALISCKKDRDSPAKGLSPESCEAGTAKVVPALVVDGLASPFDVAVDATSVYWTEVGGTGVVGVIDKDGTGRRKLISESANLPFAIALSSTHVFFQTSNEIQRVPKDGSAAPQILATGFDNLQSYGLVVDGDQVYFAARQRSDAKDGVYRVDVDGKNVVNIVSQSTGIDALSIDTEYVYFNSGSVAEPTLVRVSKAGGAPETIATGRGCHNVAATGFQVFCAADYYGPFRINVTTKSTIDLCTEWNPALLVKDAVLLGTGLYLLVLIPPEERQRPTTGDCRCSRQSRHSHSCSRSSSLSRGEISATSEGSSSNSTHLRSALIVAARDSVASSKLSTRRLSVTPSTSGSKPERCR